MLFLSPISLAQAPFPALTLTNTTTENSLQVQCGAFGSFHIPAADPLYIHWSIFFILFFGPSGTCSIISNNNVVATFTVVVSPNGQQGMVSATNVIIPGIIFTFIQGVLSQMSPNVHLTISSESKRI